jgi:hypothetical protein
MTPFDFGVVEHRTSDHFGVGSGSVIPESVQPFFYGAS